MGRRNCHDPIAYHPGVSPTWIWLQCAIVMFVVIGMVIAIIRLV
jgi:hypothetical protein